MRDPTSPVSDAIASSFNEIHFQPEDLDQHTRVGTDHLYWKSGRVGLSKNLDFECRVGSVIWSVGCRVFLS